MDWFAYKAFTDALINGDDMPVDVYDSRHMAGGGGAFGNVNKAGRRTADNARFYKREMV